MTPEEKEAAARAAAFQQLHDACPFAGQGGEYLVENGVRRLVARTGLDAAGVAAANAEADLIRQRGRAVQTSALTTEEE